MNKIYPMEMGSARSEPFQHAKFNSEEFLTSVLGQFDKIDFNKKVFGEDPMSLSMQQVFDNNFSGKLNQVPRLTLTDYYIHTVDEIFRVSVENGWDLKVTNGKTYVFNGAYWSLIEEADLRSFFVKVVAKVGIPNRIARDFTFIDKLMKQFLSFGVHVEDKTTDFEVGINLKNGYLRIKEGKVKLIDFQKDRFLTYQLNYSFDEYATCPKFQAFLNRVVPDKNLQNVLSEYIGYIFLPNNWPAFKAEKALILLGSGANGKSVFNSIITSLIGTENITQFSMSSLTDSQNGTSRAQMENKLLNYSTEVGKRSDSDLFKKIASGEPLEVRRLYKDPYIIYRYAKLIFNANELPRDVEHKEAYFRRFLIIPFDVTIPKDEQDKGLAHKIVSDELPGILNWAIAGLYRLMIQKGFTKSDIVDAKLSEYMLESDSVQLFLSENQIVPSVSKTIPRKSLYQAYQLFCQSDGYKACSKIVFNQRLTDLRFTSRRMSDGYEYFAEVKQEEVEVKPRISFKPEFDPQQSVKVYKSEFDKYFEDDE